MQSVCKLSALACAVACAAQAEQEEEAYSRLCSGLAEQVSALSGVSDGASASAVVPELRRCLSALAVLQKETEAPTLWHYIDNTPGKKQALVELLQRLCLQFNRLEEAGFYGNAELESLLSQQLNPSGDSGPDAAL